MFIENKEVKSAVKAAKNIRASEVFIGVHKDGCFASLYGETKIQRKSGEVAKFLIGNGGCQASFSCEIHELDALAKSGADMRVQEDGSVHSNGSVFYMKKMNGMIIPRKPDVQTFPFLFACFRDYLTNMINLSRNDLVGMKNVIFFNKPNSRMEATNGVAFVRYHMPVPIHGHFSVHPFMKKLSDGEIGCVDRTLVCLSDGVLYFAPSTEDKKFSLLDSDNFFPKENEITMVFSMEDIDTILGISKMGEYVYFNIRCGDLYVGNSDLTLISKLKAKVSWNKNNTSDQYFSLRSDLCRYLSNDMSIFLNEFTQRTKSISFVRPDMSFISVCGYDADMVWYNYLSKTKGQENAE